MKYIVGIIITMIFILIMIDPGGKPSNIDNDDDIN